jgi:hypothetical protein
MKQTKTNRRTYERPQMRVVELRQTGMLMVSGGDKQATMTVTYEEEDI